MPELADIKRRNKDQIERQSRKEPAPEDSEPPRVIIRDVRNSGTIIIGNNAVVKASAVNVFLIVAPDGWKGDGQAGDLALPLRGTPAAGIGRTAVPALIAALTPRDCAEMIDLSSVGLKACAEIRPVSLGTAQSVSNRLAPPPDDEPPSNPQYALASAALARLKAARARSQSDHLPTVAPGVGGRGGLP
ncbi:hypothetical protein [Tistlia consotensis]|uniref:hypothetical protein n=1 Tax=Tistlia consotensis TaxID=1321365 RepID=UPI00117CD180|nr:hypothetical protein [Tistlia consotensis]